MSKWYKNLKVSQKLMLISICFLAPNSLMFGLFITSINNNIEFARMEKKGLEYQRPLEELLDLIPQHQRLAQHANPGDPQSTEQLAAKQSQIEAAFDRLTVVNDLHGVALQFTDNGLAKRNREHCHSRHVRQEWQDLKTQLARLTPEVCATQHRHLVADVRTMITHAGDLSNLILDPDLDSYYLMDATLLALPQTQDRLAEVMADGESLLHGKSISDEDRFEIATHATLLKNSDLDRVHASLKTALNEDENFYGRSVTLHARIPAALQDYVTAAAVFNDQTTQLARSEKLKVTAAEYFAAGQKARTASFNLWKIASEELDILLQNRIASYEAQRARSLWVTVLTLLIACGFIAFITRSISDPLREQAAELTAANQTLETQIAERRRAEAELRRSEAQLTAAQTIARIGSWELDVASNKMIWSEENYRIHGFNPGEFAVSYESTLELIDPVGRGVFAAAIQTALQEGKSFSFEQCIIRPDGTERTIHQRGDVVQDQAGQSVKIFGTAQDVTERKQAEDELEKMHQELLGTSRQAGMAEVATGVLHNVGNVLNSVNVSANCVANTVRKSKAPNLAKVVALFRAHEADLGHFLTCDEKGRQVPGYLAQLAEHIAGEQAAVQKEMAELQQHIDHIKDVVTMQQSYAKVSGVKETLEAAELLEDAVRLNAGSLTHHGVTVVREFGAAPAISVEKHKALQILVNLICNAKQSCDSTGRDDKQMTLRIMNDHDRVHISVSDNGVGIPVENLKRIFNHGFTTKKTGHGFGLHNAANAAKEMGGALHVHSDGDGRGATFTLELPVHHLETSV